MAAAARGPSAVVAASQASSSLLAGGRHVELRPMLAAPCLPAAASTHALSRRWLHSLAQVRQASTAAAVKISSETPSIIEAPEKYRPPRLAHSTGRAGRRQAARAAAPPPSNPDGYWVKLSGLVTSSRPIEHVYSTLLTHQGPGLTQLGSVRVRFKPEVDADSAELHFALGRQVKRFLALGREDERLRGLALKPRDDAFGKKASIEQSMSVQRERTGNQRSGASKHITPDSACSVAAAGSDASTRLLVEANRIPKPAPGHHVPVTKSGLPPGVHLSSGSPMPSSGCRSPVTSAEAKARAAILSSVPQRPPAGVRTRASAPIQKLHVSPGSPGVEGSRPTNSTQALAPPQRSPSAMVQPPPQGVCLISVPNNKPVQEKRLAVDSEPEPTEQHPIRATAPSPPPKPIVLAQRAADEIRPSPPPKTTAVSPKSSLSTLQSYGLLSTYQMAPSAIVAAGLQLVKGAASPHKQGRHSRTAGQALPTTEAPVSAPADPQLLRRPCGKPASPPTTTRCLSPAATTNHKAKSASSKFLTTEPTLQSDIPRRTTRAKRPSHWAPKERHAAKKALFAKRPSFITRKRVAQQKQELQPSLEVPSSSSPKAPPPAAAVQHERSALRNAHAAAAAARSPPPPPAKKKASRSLALGSGLSKADISKNLGSIFVPCWKSTPSLKQTAGRMFGPSMRPLTHWVRISDLPPVHTPEAFEHSLTQILREHAPLPIESGMSASPMSPLGATVHARPGLQTVFLEFFAEEIRPGTDWHTTHQGLQRLLRACSLHRPFDDVEIELSSRKEFDAWQFQHAYPTGRRRAIHRF